MSTFVALLRGVNVGGRNRLPMADLRAALTADGLADVRTYIQSGNVVLTSAAKDPEVVATRVRSVIAREFGLDIPAVTLSGQQLEALVDRNPYPGERDPRRLHAIVLPHPADDDTVAAAAERQTAAAARGSRDAVTVVGRIAYLHTPDGFGRSELAKTLTAGARSPLGHGTARNWATVTTLLGMCR